VSFNTALNCVFLFASSFRLHGRLLKILMPEQHALFWQHERSAAGIWRSCLFLVLTLCDGELVWKYSWLFTMNFINENTYSHGRVTLSNLLNRFLHEFLGLTLAMMHNSVHVPYQNFCCFLSFVWWFSPDVYTVFASRLVVINHTTGTAALTGASRR
jgi:hypothetical protein